VSFLNDCATTESCTILLLESSYGNIPSCSWPNHSSDVVKWNLKGGAVAGARLWTVCHMTSSRVTHCHISVVDSKHFYLDSHILLFCFSFLPCGPCGFYLGHVKKFLCNVKCNFYPRDVRYKRSICCRLFSLCPWYVYLLRSCIVSKTFHLLSKLFRQLIAPTS